MNLDEMMKKRMQERAPTYLKNRVDEMIELKRALRAHEFKVFEFAGHKLKGNALSFGFGEIGVLGDRLEKAALAEDIGLIGQIVEELEQRIQFEIKHLSI